MKYLVNIVIGLSFCLFCALSQAETFYFHNDQLGTPQKLTDQGGEVVWEASYTPFGEATIVKENVEQNLRFPGQYFDKESGLHYNYFRSYDPSTGRYIQSDPVGLVAGVNTYGYVGQSPLIYIDPYGLNKRKWVNLGDGWTGGLDTFNNEGVASFEIHVFDPAGAEAGMYGPEGWFNKHGLTGRPDNIPESVENQCKGNAIDAGRRMKKIPKKGWADITGDKWKGFLRTLPIIGAGMEATKPSQETYCQLNPTADSCT